MNNSLANERPSRGLEKFVGEFYQDRLEEFSQIKDMLSKDNLNEVGRMAHKWKGFSKPYGFDLLEKLSLELEESSKSGNRQRSEELIKEIENYLGEKEKYIMEISR